MHTDRKYNKTIEEWRVQAMLSYLYTHLETNTTKQLQKIISNYQDFVADLAQKPDIGDKMIQLDDVKIKSIGVGEPVFKVWTEKDDKKLKGYQFDSLVYRYIRAREQMAEYEFYNDKTKDKKSYYDQAKRDIIRFCQILDEAIGEHD